MISLVPEKYLVEDTIDYPVCINGKKRAIATFEINATKQVIEEYALGLEEIKKWIDGRPVRKVIIVPKRMVNIVI